MGTPCSYGMKKNGVMKTTYYHWDGGVKYFGKDFLEEIKLFSLNRLSDLFDKIQMIELDSTPTLEQIKYCKKNDWYNNTVDGGKDTNWYSLLHKTLGSFKELFKVENETPLMISYPIDGYCYGYLIDFDKGMLVVYDYGKLGAIIPLEYIERNSVENLVKCLELQLADKTFEDAWESVLSNVN